MCITVTVSMLNSDIIVILDYSTNAIAHINNSSPINSLPTSYTYYKLGVLVNLYQKLFYVS